MLRNITTISTSMLLNNNTLVVEDNTQYVTRLNRIVDNVVERFSGKMFFNNLTFNFSKSGRKTIERLKENLDFVKKVFLITLLISIHIWNIWNLYSSKNYKIFTKKKRCFSNQTLDEVNESFGGNESLKEEVFIDSNTQRHPGKDGIK